MRKMPLDVGSFLQERGAEAVFETGEVITEKNKEAFEENRGKH
jgi:hypothetical protein